MKPSGTPDYRNEKPSNSACAIPRVQPRQIENFSVCTFSSPIARIFAAPQQHSEWAGPLLDKIEADRRKRLSADKLQDRQAWRDRRLMALAAHKRRAAQDIPG